MNEKPNYLGHEKVNLTFEKVAEEQKRWHGKTIAELVRKIKKLEETNVENENDEEIKETQIEINNYRKELNVIADKTKKSTVIAENKEIKQQNEEESNKKLIDSIIQREEEATIEEVTEILKNNKISQIIIHAQENAEQVEKFGFHLTRDFDTQNALYILNNLVKQSDEELYSENAVTSFIPKGGTVNDVTKDAQRTGVRLVIDTGGKWLKVEGTNGTKTIYFDHHGEGQHKPTSATEIIYEMFKKADLLKQPEPKWLKEYVNSVTEFDNLTYLDKKDEKGEKICNKEYFEKNWAKTPNALADFAPVDELIKAYKSRKIKDFTTPLTKEQIKEIGGEALVKKSEELNIEVKKTINGIINANRNNEKENLNFKNTKVGNIIYHDFPKIKPANGKEFMNQINNSLAFIGTEMLGNDTYICWNKKNETFYMNSKHPNIEEITEDLKEAYPGCIEKNIRGDMVRGKITEGMTEEKFLNTIDPKILQNKN